MALKLGELLLKEKLITPDQLDEALKNQAIFGIKLGSSLIELGFITDERLCDLLSQKLGVPAVPPRGMSWIDPDVLALVPESLAVKYHVVPLRVEGKKLALAMTDPSDYEAIDEVAFVTSCVIIPHIAPEVRIAGALTKHYHMRRDSRYQGIEGALASRMRAAPVAAPVHPAGTSANPMMNSAGELLNIEIPREFEGFSAAGYGYEDGFALPFDAVERYSVDRLSVEFASAKDRDKIAAVFIKYLGQEFRVGALFIIRDTVAIGWRGVAAGKRIEKLENLHIPLSEQSVLRSVRETRQFSMGALAEIPENLQLLAILGVDSGTPLLVLPIIMLNKVVAEVVVSAEMDALGARLQELQKLVYKASLAFEMLIIRNKILMT